MRDINGMREVSYLSARLYDSMGSHRVSLRDRAAQRFVELTSERTRNMREEHEAENEEGDATSKTEFKQESKRRSDDGVPVDVISTDGLQRLLIEWS